MSDPRIKTLKIKFGIVKRLTKEISMYGKEAEKQRQKIDKMKSDSKDEHDIRKQEEVLQESLMMIPDCRRRLVTALADLKGILDSEQDLVEIEEYQTATSIAAEADAVVLKRD